MSEQTNEPPRAPRVSSGRSTVAGIDAVLLVRLRRGDDAPAGDGDHAVAGGEVLEAAIDDAFLRALHALDHRLVLLADALDAGIRLAARLLLAVDQVVVAAIAP